MPCNSIAVYASHDASVCVCVNGAYRIYELERLTKNRYEYLNLGQIINPEYKSILEKIHGLIEQEFGDLSFEICYINNINQEIKDFIGVLWGISKFTEVSHHQAHAATSYYLSGFKEALIISYDGGGLDLDGVSYFNVYLAQNSSINKILKFQHDLGTAYLEIGKPIKEIRKGGTNLSIPGKLMGLYAYGKVIPDYVEALKVLFKSTGQSSVTVKALGDKLNLNLCLDGIENEDSFNIAASAQVAFEEVVFEALDTFIANYGNVPICLSGGCALNVLMNERIRKRYGAPVFVPPNPSDCGLSLGMLLSENPPKSTPSIAYSGPRLFDLNNLPTYIKEYGAKKVSPKEVAALLSKGAIIGVATGGAECGPRALGNRSIICDAGIEGMKDILNDKVKHREWFRPFAPFVKEDKCQVYFDFDGTSPFMSFAAPVKDIWRDRLKAITHVDGTARIQTVKKEEHNLFYEILNEFEKIKGYSVLLNTSFNIRGRPILNTIEDALSVLQETEMDYVYIEGYLFKDKRED
jgi:carbamoyltransferase